MNIRRYRESDLSKPLNPFYQILEPHLPAPGKAFDLGCGTGKGAAWLANRGFDVVAVDSDPEMIAVAEDLHGGIKQLDFKRADIAALDFPDSILVTSVFTLFFLPPSDLARTWQRIIDCLSPGGVLAGQLLGPNDTWATTGASTQSLAEVSAMLTGLNVLHFEEVDRDGKTIWGEPKHWHVFHIIVQKP